MICYDFAEGIAVFSPHCPKCGQFIKAGSVWINGLGEIRDENNATCSKCGEIKMRFEGWYDPEDFEPLNTAK